MSSQRPASSRFGESFYQIISGSRGPSRGRARGRARAFTGRGRGRARGLGRGRGRGHGRSLDNQVGQNERSNQYGRQQQSGYTQYRNPNNNVPPLEKRARYFSHAVNSRPSSQPQPDLNHMSIPTDEPQREPVQRDAMEDVDMQRRRKDKRVPRGGSIPKDDKVQEYQTDLYCAICEETFRDPSSKTSHDRSRRHHNRYQQLRTSGALDEDGRRKEQQLTEEEFRKQMSASQTRKQLEERLSSKSAMFTEEDLSKWPREFKDWAIRSLQNAAKLARAERDGRINAAVRTEIRSVYDHHHKHCTLRKEPWCRRPLATGELYGKIDEMKSIVLVVHEDQLVKRPSPPEQGRQTASPPPPVSNDHRTGASDVEMTDEPINALGAQQSMHVDEQQNDESTRGNQSSVLENYRRAHYEFPEPSPKHRRVEGSDRGRYSGTYLVASGSRARHPRAPFDPYSAYRPHTMPIERPRSLEEDKPKVKEHVIHWDMSQESQDRQLACKVSVDKDLYLTKCQERFGSTRTWWEPADITVRDSNELTSLLETVDRLKKQYESGEYEYRKLCDQLTEVVTKLRNRGTRKVTLHECIRVQVCAALQMGFFNDFAMYCSNLMRESKSVTHWGDFECEFVGHWLLSLLFSYTKDKNRFHSRTPQTMIRVAEEMRRFPVGQPLLHDMRVYECSQVLKAVLNNNWVYFFNRFGKSIVHMATNGRTRQVMEGLIPFMRERALVTMLKKSAWSESPVYCQPNMVPLESVMRFLGWNHTDDEDPAFVADEARQFITSLPINFVILGGDVHNTQSAYMRAEEEEGQLQSTNSGVDVEALLAWSGRSCPAVRQ